MAQKQYNQNYINGVFVKKIETEYGDMFLMDINNDALNEISQLPENENGFHRLKITPQRNDKTKLSVSENEYQPAEKPKSGGYGKPQQPRNKRTPF